MTTAAIHVRRQTGSCHPLVTGSFVARPRWRSGLDYLPSSSELMNVTTAAVSAAAVALALYLRSFEHLLPVRLVMGNRIHVMPKRGQSQVHAPACATLIP